MITANPSGQTACIIVTGSPVWHCGILISWLGNWWPGDAGKCWQQTLYNDVHNSVITHSTIFFSSYSSFCFAVTGVKRLLFRRWIFLDTDTGDNNKQLLFALFVPQVSTVVTRHSLSESRYLYNRPGVVHKVCMISESHPEKATKREMMLTIGRTAHY